MSDERERWLEMYYKLPPWIKDEHCYGAGRTLARCCEHPDPWLDPERAMAEDDNYRPCCELTNRSAHIYFDHPVVLLREIANDKLFSHVDMNKLCQIVKLAFRNWYHYHGVGEAVKNSEWEELGRYDPFPCERGEPYFITFDRIVIFKPCNYYDTFWWPLCDSQHFRKQIRLAFGQTCAVCSRVHGMKAGPEIREIHDILKGRRFGTSRGSYALLCAECNEEFSNFILMKDKKWSWSSSQAKYEAMFLAWISHRVVKEAKMQISATHQSERAQITAFLGAYENAKVEGKDDEFFRKNQIHVE